MSETILTLGAGGDALTLAAILGRQPRTLRAFFEELAALDPGHRS